MRGGCTRLALARVHKRQLLVHCINISLSTMTGWRVRTDILPTHPSHCDMADRASRSRACELRRPCSSDTLRVCFAVPYIYIYAYTQRCPVEWHHESQRLILSWTLIASSLPSTERVKRMGRVERGNYR